MSKNCARRVEPSIRVFERKLNSINDDCQISAEARIAIDFLRQPRVDNHMMYI